MISKASSLDHMLESYALNLIKLRALASKLLQA